MKLIRLPSGPLACVYAERTNKLSPSERGKTSGVFRAFSGSVEADGVSEQQAMEALDERVRRLSTPPPAEIAEFELQREAANDVSHWDRERGADSTGRYVRFDHPETMPAPTSSARGL